jgi:hypothetical protein
MHEFVSLVIPWFVGLLRLRFMVRRIMADALSKKDLWLFTPNINNPRFLARLLAILIPRFLISAQASATVFSS